MSLKPGCYLVSFNPNPPDQPSSLPTYVGTLRVVDLAPREGARAGSRTTAPNLRVSGDLYRLSEKAKKAVFLDQWMAIAQTDAAEGVDVPVFPLSDYSYYLEVLSMKPGDSGCSVLDVQAHKFDPATRRLAPGAVCQLALTPDPDVPDPDAPAFTGSLTRGGAPRGRFYLQWISEDLRRADLRMFRLSPGVRAPRAADAERVPEKAEWERLFRSIGWRLAVSVPKDVPAGLIRPEGERWAPYDLSTAALKLRESIPDPDLSWTYDLLCVSQFEDSQYLGIMFDSEATDLNDRPRESAAVAALQPIVVEGKSLAAQDAFEGRLYHRTALHEVGHAMNLPHNFRGITVMNISKFLLTAAPFHADAAGNPEASAVSAGRKKNGRQKDGGASRSAAAERGFANKFRPHWSFDWKDIDWLQHAPDIAVRPGGISRNAVRWQCCNEQQVTALSIYNVGHLSLVVNPIEPGFPHGAPVRLEYSLTNHGPAVEIPDDISLRGGHVSGRVIGPDRETRYFRSAFRCCDSVKARGGLKFLKESGAAFDSMTLLRGTDGPLFPTPGSYQVEIELRWDAGVQTNRVKAQTTVTIDGDADGDRRQAPAAEQLLNRPSMMPALVQGSLDADGLILLSHALNSATLAGHYLATAIKCRLMANSRNREWNDLIAAARARFVEQQAAELSEPSNPRGFTGIPGSKRAGSKSRAGAAVLDLSGDAVVCTRREVRLFEKYPGSDALVTRTAIAGAGGVVTVRWRLTPAAALWLRSIQSITLPALASSSKPRKAAGASK